MHKYIDVNKSRLQSTPMVNKESWLDIYTFGLHTYVYAFINVIKYFTILLCYVYLIHKLTLIDDILLNDTII